MTNCLRATRDPIARLINSMIRTRKEEGCCHVGPPASSSSSSRRPSSYFHRSVNSNLAAAREQDESSRALNQSWEILRSSRLPMVPRTGNESGRVSACNTDMLIKLRDGKETSRVLLDRLVSSARDVLFCFLSVSFPVCLQKRRRCPRIKKRLLGQETCLDAEFPLCFKK